MYRQSDKEFQHEVSRINQFKQKARDDDHFRQLIFNRAAKCSPDKRRRFIETLRRMGREDLAAFIDLLMKQRGENGA